MLFLLSLSCLVGLYHTYSAQQSLVPETIQTTPCGDANMDGSVNVLDIITMVNYIMGSNPTPFSFAAADINASGAVDVLDIISVINMIMQVPGLPCPCTPTVTDVDGNVYQTVKIGEQCWMKENLRTGAMINSNAGGQQQTDNGVLEKYCYNNLMANCAAYGGLYEWREAMKYSETIGAQGICPAGWHIPKDTEWTMLFNYLGGAEIAGGKMKLAGTSQWNAPNTGATNQSNFTALPSGLRSMWAGSFTGMNTNAYYLSSTLTFQDKAWSRGLYHNYELVDRGNIESSFGQAVRCIKDQTGIILPSVRTLPASGITATSATLGGLITDDGGTVIIERGIYWGTTTSPQFGGMKVPVGSGGGAFSVVISGLLPSKIYNFITYATNSAGTTFGHVETFTSAAGPDGCNTLTDIDGNVYNAVLIGSQCWMKENLKTTSYKNGSPIPYPGTNNTVWQNTTSGAYAWYENNIAWKDLYGALYNWYAVNSTFGLCPIGWHMPSATEWDQLSDFVGGAGGAGGKLKSLRTTPAEHPRWQSPNVGASDQYGFSALAGGCRENAGPFSYIGYTGYWWTSTEHFSPFSWARTMQYDRIGVDPLGINRKVGLSVRCLKDITLPSVTTSGVSDITSSAATAGGNVTSDGGAVVTARGICYNTDPNPTTANTTVLSGSGNGSFTANLTGLNAGTTYNVRAYATNSAGTAYGDNLQFTTNTSNFSCGTSVITDIDGNLYNTVLIGNQCWMKENLKTTRFSDGSPIEYPGNNTSLWSGTTSGAYAWFDNDISWKDVYGALYNWYAVKSFDGLCPEGWHIPINEELNELDEYLGGSSVAGGKLKSTRKQPEPHPRWDLPNTGASNSSGFTGYPGGYRHNDGRYLNLGYSANWWSATMTSATIARYLNLGVDYVNSFRGTRDKATGFSVRCLRD